MNGEEIAKLSNKMTLENMMQLIHIFSDRISIFAGMIPGDDDSMFCISGELDKETPACFNGASIQINMERAFNDDNDNYLCELLKHGDLKKLKKEKKQ
jgi:hypothetical protein